MKTFGDYGLPDYFAYVRAYDANGRQLKQLKYLSSHIEGGVESRDYDFWGIPAEVRVVSIEKWLNLDIPFHLPPAPKLPKTGG